MKHSVHSTEGGYIMIMNTLLFIAILMTIIIGVANAVLAHYVSAQAYISSKQSYLVAQSATEEALYRLKNNLNMPSSLTMTLPSGSATISVATISGGKTVTVNSQQNNYQRNTQLDLTLGTGVSFHYGIQAGNGGFILNGGAVVNGNVYSNGDIVATNGVTISGSAIAANSISLITDQANDTPATPTNNISFRDTSTNQDFAQSFTVSGSALINKASFYIKKVGAPSDITVRIVNDSSGSPGTTNIFTTQGTLTASQVSTSAYGWVDVVFPQNVQLVAGVTYWIVLDNGSQSATNYYIIGGNTSYAGGAAKIGKYSGTWNNTSPSGLDGYFRIYLGGINSSLGGDSYPGGVYVGSAGVGDAWAHDVQGATVAGSLWCQTGSNNNKSCNTSRPDPSPQPYPVSDANIQDWKDEASAGGVTSGSVTVGSSNGTIGPREITGNLTVNGGGTLTVNGTIWVHGTLTVSGGGKIKLSSAYGSNGGVIVTDGNISLGGGGDLSGSGQTGSYLMVLTTSNCPLGPTCGGTNALTLSGGAGAVVLNAQNGTMILNGGSGVHEATAYQISVSGGADITYDAGLANMNFSSGPGGAYNISDWTEI